MNNKENKDKITEKKIKNKFNQLNKQAEPKPPLAVHCAKAFIVGGGICVVGQIIKDIMMYFGVAEPDAANFLSIIMVFIGAFLTGIGVYDKIGEFSGAGSLVPITGFANSIVSPAIEFKSEGFILGLGAKMFTIAGPVLVYGIGSSVIVGLIYYIFNL